MNNNHYLSTGAGETQRAFELPRLLLSVRAKRAHQGSCRTHSKQQFRVAVVWPPVECSRHAGPKSNGNEEKRLGAREGWKVLQLNYIK